jgi:hypothetical protein
MNEEKMRFFVNEYRERLFFLLGDVEKMIEEEKDEEMMEKMKELRTLLWMVHAKICEIEGLGLWKYNRR